MNQTKHFTIFFLKFNSNCAVERSFFFSSSSFSIFFSSSSFFFFLNVTFAREILDLISHVHLVSFVYQASRNTPHSTAFFIYRNLWWSSDSHYLSPPLTFISIPQCLPTSISLSVMPCSTISSIASHKILSAYFTVPIICPTLKSQNLSTASLVWYL